MSERRFDTQATLGEVYAFPGASPINATRHVAMVESGNKGDEWWGNVKRCDAVQFANSYTMPDSARALYATLMEDLPVFTTATKRRVRHRQEQGDAIYDVAAYEAFRHGVTRDASFWSDMHRKERKARGVVSIGINTATASNQSQTELEFRGAAALALTDYLEGMGYRVQLLALMSSKHGIETLNNTAVELKPANGMLSENGMAFCCHLGVWRHFYLEYLASQPFDVDFGYGNARDYTGSVVVDVTVPKDVTTEYDARKWLTETMALLRGRGE